MRRGITAKLFYTILAVSIFAVIAMSIGSRISFTHGFLGYLNEQGMQRIDTILPGLVEAYEAHGSWEHLRGDQRAWIETLALYSTNHGNNLSSGVQPEVTLPGFGLRIALLDAEGKLVAGNPEIGRNSPRRPIVVNGKQVGSLALQQFQEVRGAGGTANLRFERRQLYTTIFIALGTVLISGVVAMWMTRRFLSGLRQVSNSVQHLADGDYSVRAPAVSRDEIGVLAANCNKLAQTLEFTEQTRRDFMADVSHELRTPLSVLQAEIEALEDGVRQPNIESYRSLQGEVKTLKNLVDDLYSLSLAEAGAQAFRMEPTDLVECVHTVVDAFRDRLMDRGIQVDIELGTQRVEVMADRTRLWQLFANVVENSIRYAAAGEVLRVQCRAERTRALIVFDDAGPGVADDLLARIFERFYRVDGSRNRASGGTGLGLAICKSIAKAHGGTISARRSALGGLCVLITLPTTA